MTSSTNRSQRFGSLDGVRYLSVEMAARYLGISATALRQRVARRTIPFIKDRKTVRFDMVDLDNFMAARRVGTADEVRAAHRK